METNSQFLYNFNEHSLKEIFVKFVMLGSFIE